MLYDRFFNNLDKIQFSNLINNKIKNSKMFLKTWRISNKGKKGFMLIKIIRVKNDANEKKIRDVDLIGINKIKRTIKY